MIRFAHLTVSPFLPFVFFSFRRLVLRQLVSYTASHPAQQKEDPHAAATVSPHDQGFSHL